MFRRVWTKIRHNPHVRSMTSSGAMGLGIGLAAALLSAVAQAESLDSSSTSPPISDEAYVKLQLDRMKEKEANCRVCHPTSMASIGDLYKQFNASGKYRQHDEVKHYVPIELTSSNLENLEPTKTQVLPKDEPTAPESANDPIPGMKGKIVYVDVEPETPPTRIRVQMNDDGTMAPLECPADYYQLAHGTWTHLHTMAAYFPPRPSEELQNNTKIFMDVVSKTYPCEPCRDHMQQFMKNNPVTAGNNRELSVWVCKLHNDVNRILGKPIVSCDPAYLLRRYKDGYDDGTCQ